MLQYEIMDRFYIDENVFLTQMLQRYVVPTVLVCAGIVLFAYMISKGKKKQGIISLATCLLVAVGWLVFVLMS